MDHVHAHKSESTQTKVVTQGTTEQFDIVKATQYGMYDRCKELLNEGFDVNQRDNENITLLHWAAINCRKDIVKMYLDAGAMVDSLGGELNSTALHWATRQGHLSMVVMLMKHGADPTIRDGEGCSAIHLAAQFGFTSIVAYLLAKGVNVDIQDGNGMTPLMWSVCRVHSSDPARLLLTFGASMSLQDKDHQNTPLHWAIQTRNNTAVNLLFNRSSPFDIQNEGGDTAYSLLKTMKTAEWIGKKQVVKMLEKMDKLSSSHKWWHSIRRDKKVRFYGTAAIPFFVMYTTGLIFAAEMSLMIKAVLLTGLYLVIRATGHVVCDDRFMSIFPISVYLATKMWMYLVWFLYITPVLPFSHTVFMVVVSLSLWYNFIRAWRGDPGVIHISTSERYQTIIELAEQDGFDPKYFCTTCLVRKPIRSKHCSVCDRCVARFDHHCPWLSNCVGWKNHKFFVGYLAALVAMCVIYFVGVLNYWNMQAKSDWTFWTYLSYQPWVTFMAAQAFGHFTWVLVLLVCQLYQILLLGVTTNERLNWTRYSYFRGTNSHGHGHSHSHSRGGMGKAPFNRGVVRNFIDFFEIRCLRPERIDWMRLWASDEFSRDDDFVNMDTDHLLPNHRDNFQYV